jgi:hypothetical protein
VDEVLLIHVPLGYSRRSGRIASKEGAYLETQGLKSHEEYAVQLEAIPPARMVNQFVTERCWFKRNAATEQNVEVLERNRIGLGAVESLKPILGWLHASRIVEAREVSIKRKDRVVHSFFFPLFTVLG